MSHEDTDESSPTVQTEPAVLLTATEVAALLRVTTRTVWRWAAAGRLQRVQIGGVVRYPAVAVEALIGGCEGQNVSSPTGRSDSTHTTAASVEDARPA